MMDQYASATVVSAACNYIMERPEKFTHTYRTYVKLRENGALELRFWHSNAIDSTWDTGSVARGGTRRRVADRSCLRFRRRRITGRFCRGQLAGSRHV
ncbi:hypothetical protein HMSSN139_43670 [Paenibacillus sp. HMSSN-139]|nr:hypothetical protein HMSSN139_43670 [Paenibacillus sp. HMSSN-139]